MRKKYQKKLNKIIREANKKLDEDNLILGRFKIKQINANWYKFDDNSGGILYTTIRCFDHYTRQYKDFLFDYAPYYQTLYWHLYMDIINTFIVNDINWGVKCVGDFRNFKIPNIDQSIDSYSFHQLKEY